MKKKFCPNIIFLFLSLNFYFLLNFYILALKIKLVIGASIKKILMNTLRPNWKSAQGHQPVGVLHISCSPSIPLFYFYVSLLKSFNNSSIRMTFFHQNLFFFCCWKMVFISKFEVTSGLMWDGVGRCCSNLSDERGRGQLSTPIWCISNWPWLCGMPLQFVCPSLH